MTTAAPYAALMGDLVHSEGHRDTARLHRAFNTAIARGNSHGAAAIASPLTITLGDEFQGLVYSLREAAILARAIRFDLAGQGIECRFAIGLVHLATALNVQQAWNMLGPGLAATREKLDAKNPDNLYRFALGDEPVTEALLEACGATLTFIERGWSDTQRRYVTELVDGRSVAEIAGRHAVSPAAVYKVRASGHHDLYALQWDTVLDTLAALDTKHQLPGAG